MKRWYAVHSKPRQEAVAEQHLQNQGFSTYLPKISVRKQRRGRWVKVVEPLFPRYLFIQCDPDRDNTAPVRSTRGAVGMVRIGSELRPVPDEVIDFLKQAEDDDEQARQDDSWPHEPGDRVKVLEGPFAGLEGVYREPVAENRAILLLEILGRETPITVEMQSLSPN
jgi:transcriptional antiterminator RfaH